VLVIDGLLPETVVNVQLIVEDEDKLPDPDCSVNKIDEPEQTFKVSPDIWLGFVVKSATCPNTPTLLTINKIASESKRFKNTLCVKVCKLPKMKCKATHLKAKL
jgi:hypothetical protein